MKDAKREYEVICTSVPVSKKWPISAITGLPRRGKPTPNPPLVSMGANASKVWVTLLSLQVGEWMWATGDRSRFVRRLTDESIWMVKHKLDITIAFDFLKEYPSRDLRITRTA
jgi:hypothetical protein